jgi:hypothetical protein
MLVVVVYESMFGNTRKIATAVAEGLRGCGDVVVTEVGAASAPSTDCDLLVVGAPTHAFGLSRPQTRLDAARQAPAGIVSTGRGVREWIEDLSGPATMPVAVFDTRIKKGWLTGSAARAAAKRLRHKGYRLIVAPESFVVTDSLGPLADGEAARARQWGELLGEQANAAANAEPGR